jgi:hypothetical protein
VLAAKYSLTAFILCAFSVFSFAFAQGEEAPVPSAPGEIPSSPNESSPAPAQHKKASISRTEPDNPLASPPVTTLNPAIDTAQESRYLNYAVTGHYENETWFSEIPEWHYYDAFGNKIMDGFYLYGLTMNRQTQGTGLSNVILHPILKKWLNGLAEVSDIRENSGILAMIGDRIKSEFTPFSLNQSLFAGARFDAYYKQNSLTFLTNRISNTGIYGMLTDSDIGHTPRTSADWITGGHGARYFGEAADIGGTYVNLHHENSRTVGNPFSGMDSFPLIKKTPTGLSLYGLNGNLKLGKIKAYGEFLRSQEFLDGDFLPKAGDVAVLKGSYDILDKLWLGGEFYSVGSRFKTTFLCPAHVDGDQSFATGNYQYALVEDNDDNDDFPENGRSKYPYYSPNINQGDPDGVMPVKYDKDKNGIFDFKEDFLNFGADPPESQILFDRNNNGVPEEIENDAYPDYPYVPSYYLPGERYWRFDDMDGVWENMTADTLTHKGLAGLHLSGRYAILQNLEVTAGGIFDKNQESSFQTTYENGRKSGEQYDVEKAISLYFLAHYKKVIAEDKYFTIDNYFHKVQDNIPNHTQGFSLDPGTLNVTYWLVPDELDYRDMIGDALRAQFTLSRSRGLNYTGVGKYEFQKHVAHLEFNYPDETISSLTLLNKAHYIYLLPVKDMFLIPRYMNYWDIKNYGPRPDSAADSALDAKYRRNAMVNAASLIFDWKVTDKITLTTGVQLKKFDDLLDNRENYWEPCFRLQVMVRDRYSGYLVALTAGFTQYAYLYGDKTRMHNPFNNPHGVVRNIDAHEIFARVHCGFL